MGRHKGVKRNERICQVCREGIESEIHFLIECPLYTKLRLTYFENNINSTWIESMHSIDKPTTSKLANFIAKAFDLRKRMLDLRAYFN